MTVNKRKKNSRQRGSKTHGWGAMKKRRGFGNRGGKGAGGSGKKSDAKKPSFPADYFGKYGFSSKSRTHISAVNVSYLDTHIGRLEKEGMATRDKDVFVLDLSKMGHNKLLGSGKVTKKLKITVSIASKRAVDKVASAGGQVISEVVEAD